MQRFVAVPVTASPVPAVRRTVIRPQPRRAPRLDSADTFHGAGSRQTVELQKAAWYRRWHKPYQAVPATPTEREVERQLVLDVDDLAVAVAAGGPTGPLGMLGGEPLLGTLLGVGAGLATWFGVIASIRQVNSSTHGLRHLRAQAARLKDEQGAIGGSSAWSAQRRQALMHLLEFTRHDRRLEIALLTFSGAVIALGSTLEIAGYLTDSALLGAAIPALAVASTPLLTAGVPLIAVFAGGNAVLNFQRYACARAQQAYVRGVAATSPWDPVEVSAQALLEQRLREIKTITMVNGIGFTGICIGAPLSFFGGLYGAALLAPSIVLAGVGSYIENAKLAYQNPLGVTELMTLVTMEQITNTMGLVHCDYQLLKRFKHTKRRIYPYGMSAPFLVRGLMAPWQAISRNLSADNDSRATPEQVLHAYAIARGRLLITYLKQNVAILRGYLEREDDPHLRLELLRSQNKLAAVHRHNTELAKLGLGLSIGHRIQRLLGLLTDCQVLAPFAETLAQDKDLRKLLGLQGDRCIVDLQQLQRLVCAAPHAELLLDRLCERAEHMFFTVVKDWRHSRVRELADLALFRAQQQKEFRG